MIKKVTSGIAIAGMLMFFTVSASSQVDPALIQKAKAAGVTQEQIDAALAGQKEATGARNQVGEITSSGTERQQPERVVPDIRFPEDTVIVPERMVFGRDIFSSRNLTFAPDYNMATPPGYVLGPGDELVIDVWGASEMNVRTKVSPEGSIILSGVGPVYLNGLTITDAGERIRGNLKKVMGGIGTLTQVRVTLGQIRTIKVHLAGEVRLPGTYTLPSLATLFNALYSAGGVNDIGSLREIKLYRDSKEIASLDAYDFLINGRFESNIRLEDNDMIIVAPYVSHIVARGRLKRPRIYETRSGETLSDLIRFAGGFTGDAYTENIQVKRKSGRMQEIHTVNRDEFATFGLADGDTVFVDSIFHEYSNRLLLKGAVWRPGEYQLSDETDSLSKLIAKAEGLKGNEFATRGQITRQRSDYTHEIISFNVRAAVAGEGDIALKSSDEIYIPTIFDMREEYYVIVKGEVNRPDTLPFRENMTVEDVILQTGGFKESASLVQIEVARRIKDPESVSYNDKTAEIFTFNVSHDLKADMPAAGFSLKPFDEIIVRSSPGYQQQAYAIVSGEVLFGGEYVLATDNERLSDLVRKAGGFNPNSYLRGAHLRRKMTDDERSKIESLLRVVAGTGDEDTISYESLIIEDSYLVGIDLEKALKRPGGYEDIVLMPGDHLIIPKYNGVVKVSGMVLHPNAVTYVEDLGMRGYLSRGGGYKAGARRTPYVVYMNGNVASTRKFLFFRSFPHIEPGCEIIVPMKPSKDGGMSLAEILGMSSTSVSMASVVAMLINALK
ncbi:MAG: SLBB domain-containing protein [Bacteroidales bacterium]|jgi:protein involved in polysaccharide export with SLBB domain|nr:SLBB domain-containing protein [Bacteroidales bacterium]